MKKHTLIFKCLKINGKKNHIYIYSDTLFCALLKPFGSDYSFMSSWLSCYKHGIPGFGDCLPILFAAPLKLCQDG